MKKDFRAERKLLDDRLEFIKKEYDVMEKSYEAIMEDFDRKCQEQYNQRRDRNEFADEMKASRYERHSDEDSDSEDGL